MGVQCNNIGPHQQQCVCVCVTPQRPLFWVTAWAVAVWTVRAYDSSSGSWILREHSLALLPVAGIHHIRSPWLIYRTLAHRVKHVSSVACRACFLCRVPMLRGLERVWCSEIAEQQICPLTHRHRYTRWLYVHRVGFYSLNCLRKMTEDRSLQTPSPVIFIRRKPEWNITVEPLCFQVVHPFSQGFSCFQIRRTWYHPDTDHV